MSTPWIVAYAALSMVALTSALAVVGVLHRISLVLDRAERHLHSLPAALAPGGLPAGSVAPSFELATLGGRLLTRDEVLGQPFVLVFLDTDCPVCASLENSLTQSTPFDATRLIIVCRTPQHAKVLAAALRLEIAIDINGYVSHSFQSNVRPHSFVVDSDGIILASGTPNTAERIEQLIFKTKGGVAQSSEDNNTRHALA